MSLFLGTWLEMRYDFLKAILIDDSNWRNSLRLLCFLGMKFKSWQCLLCNGSPCGFCSSTQHVIMHLFELFVFNNEYFEVFIFSCSSRAGRNTIRLYDFKLYRLRWLDGVLLFVMIRQLWFMSLVFPWWIIHQRLSVFILVSRPQHISTKWGSSEILVWLSHTVHVPFRVSAATKCFCVKVGL